jgi:hypothetical protein
MHLSSPGTMEFSTLLTALASELKIPALEVDAQGHCPLKIDGMTLLLCAIPEGNAVGLIAPTGAIDPQDDESLEMLLAANLSSTPGAQLGIDTNHNVLLMQWFALDQLEFPRFFKAMEDFVNYGEYWTGQLNSSNHVKN